MSVSLMRHLPENVFSSQTMLNIEKKHKILLR